MHIFALRRLQSALAPVQALADTAQAEAQTAAATIAGQELQLQLAALDMRDMAQRITSLTNQLSAANTKLVQQEAQAAAVNGKVVTLQDLSNDYQAQVAASLADRAKLRQDVDALSAQNLALQNRFRTKVVNTPAMGIGASVTVAIIWDTPFADAAYRVGVLPSSSSLVGVQWSLASGQTKTGCSIILKNAGLAALLAAAGQLHLTAIHD